MSKYLDEYTIGAVYTTSARTVTETDVVMFACTTGDMHPNHTDAERMAVGQFGQRIAHGLLGLAWAHGFLCRLDLITDSAIAFLRVDYWDFKAPIFLGDTLHAQITVADVVPSKSKPDRGILKLQFDLINQSGRVYQSGLKSIMMKRTAASGKDV